ncbi:hypothetical protein KCV07_g20, partial [Aureobasidium melanogenum]
MSSGCHICMVASNKHTSPPRVVISHRALHQGQVFCIFAIKISAFDCWFLSSSLAPLDAVQISISKPSSALVVAKASRTASSGLTTPISLRLREITPILAIAPAVLQV